MEYINIEALRENIGGLYNENTFVVEYYSKTKLYQILRTENHISPFFDKK